MFTKISSWSCTDYFGQQTVINVKFSHKIIHISRTWSLMTPLRHPSCSIPEIDRYSEKKFEHSLKFSRAPRRP